jgi:photosystem II P680 reaction center D1 protein
LFSQFQSLATRSLRETATWADVINRANIGFEVMHERNAHNFPLDLASSDAIPMALTAAAING